MPHHTTETPLRTLVATAPSGGEIRFIKRDDSPSPSLSFYQNNLSETESVVFWKAKLAAEKSGAAQWEKAISILRAGGWSISGVLD